MVVSRQVHFIILITRDQFKKTFTKLISVAIVLASTNIMIIIHHYHYHYHHHFHHHHHHHHHHHVIIIAIITMQIISPFRVDIFQSFFCKLNKLWIKAFFPRSEIGTSSSKHFALQACSCLHLLFSYKKTCQHEKLPTQKQNLIVLNNQSGTLFEPWNFLHLGITKYTATLSPVVQKEDNKYPPDKSLTTG